MVLAILQGLCFWGTGFAFCKGLLLEPAKCAGAVLRVAGVVSLMGARNGMRVGAAYVSALKTVYTNTPWLSQAVGNLRVSVCNRKILLNFAPRPKHKTD